MAITMKEFEEADRPLDERVISTLRQQKGKALDLIDIIADTDGHTTRDEVTFRVLIERLEVPGRGSTYARYEAVLDALVDEGRVRTASVRGATYYVLATDTDG